MFVIKDGRPLIVRAANFQDALDLNAMAANIYGSSNEVVTTLDEFQQHNNFQAQLQRIKYYQEHQGKCLLVAELEGRLVGMIDFDNGNKQRIQHTGEVGMGVIKGCRNQGIGRCLFESLIQWARENPLIEKMKLQVFVSNERGIHLYKDLGFQEEGRRSYEIKMADGSYLDVIDMYLMVDVPDN